MYALTADAFVPGQADRATAGALDKSCILGKKSKSSNETAIYTLLTLALGICTYTGTPPICI